MDDIKGIFKVPTILGFPTLYFRNNSDRKNNAIEDKKILINNFELNSQSILNIKINITLKPIIIKIKSIIIC